MERRTFGDILRGLILLELYTTSVCGSSSPCMPHTDPAGLYTVYGSVGNMWFVGIPSGTTVQVSVRCDQGAIAQPSVMTQCVNGMWLQPWPRCERPCSVPRSRENVQQYVNGLDTMPISGYTSHVNPMLPDGTRIVARCSDPGKFRLSGDQYRTCYGGQWTGMTGVEPECNSVSTKVLFFGAQRQVASNGTVIVFVYDGNPKSLDVQCRSKWSFAHLTTPLANDSELKHWHNWNRKRYTKRLNPISIEYSGIYTCKNKMFSTSSHGVHVLFKAAECEAPTAPEHGRLQDGDKTVPTRAIFSSGSTVSFVCDEDFRLVGSRVITCQKAQWTDVPPVCKVNRCPELYVPTYAVMIGVYGTGRYIGDERIFHCYQGYILRGETNKLRCMEDGNWSHPLPTCEAIVTHTSPCDGVRCESWERCVVTGPDTAKCGCINPTSCSTSGPRVCGTNGQYYTSECHMRALACLLNFQVDIADGDNVCIYGVPNVDEPTTPVTEAEEKPDPAVDLSSSFVDIVYDGITPPMPSAVDESPPHTDGEDSDCISFFSSFIFNDPSLNNEEIVGETTQLPSGLPTRQSATLNISHEEGKTARSPPTQTTGLQTSQTSEPTQSDDLQTSEPTQFNDLQTSEPSQFNDLQTSEPPQFNDLQTSEPPQFNDLQTSEPPQFNDLQTSEPPQFNDLQTSAFTKSSGLQTSEPTQSNGLTSEPAQSKGLQTSAPTQSNRLQTSEPPQFNGLETS